jgi:hypothetical protein
MFSISIQNLIKTSVFTLAFPALIACNAVSSDTSTATATDSSTSADSAAAVTGSLFGNSGSGAQLTVSTAVLERFVEAAEEDAEHQDNDTCEPLISGEDQGPDGVSTAAYGDPGVYGSQNNEMAVEEGDFCAAADGTENEGDGPDGNGRFGAFEITDDVLFECTDEGVESIVMQAGSYGIFRNTAETEDAPAYQPQIFGSFSYLIDGTDEVALDCTIYLDQSGTIAYADCSDEDGAVVVQESDTTCSHVE